ncbi:MAG TPA: M14 family zinc carboxypeptidase [Gemmatimonadaceae bacterium]|nr:M14 family zinc carboxypeptidase [Gemmatimonadaceae bacterium]
MSRPTGPARRWMVALVATGALVLAPSRAQLRAQSATQKLDQEYTAKIKQYLTDPRISTELVDHLPASATVPTPLKFNGHIVGTPGELTHTEQIHAYLEAVAKAAPKRARFWKIGKSEEGRDIVLFAVGDEQTIANLDKYKGYINALSDPRKTTEAQAQQIIHTLGKPVYYINSGMHSPETGGPEMLMELAYRLVVEETPFIQDIRKNVITLITPVVEVDGRDKIVDSYYYAKAHPGVNANQLRMYWGKYVQHDNNRDGMGQYLKLTQAVTKEVLDWTPTVLHDLHEAQTYLYASTGTGPYNEALDPIVVNEWWLLAENDVMEMTKRGVPGVWTYGFYDGWVPNYMFFIAHTHNEIGRFYEVQSYGPDNYTVTPGATTTSREWFRPNPPLETINWGPRANTNIQESAILFALHRVGQDRSTFLENQWDKAKRAVARGKTGPVYAWVIPAGQHAKENAAEAVNELLAQGLEFQRANASFKAGNVQVNAGDYIVRGDQPYRTLADMYFSLQNFAPQNPAPYDDTGWTFPLMRNITVEEVTDKSVLAQGMTPVKSDVTAPGGITGTGNVVAVANTSDNSLVAFRFKFPNVKMQAAEAAFDADGQHFDAGSLIIPNANRAQLEPELKTLGLTGVALASAPGVATHELDVPRIGYVHSWSRTQDEGWTRAALDFYGVPYHYFGENVLKEGNLRAKYDVIIYPTGGAGLNGGGGFGGRGGAGGAAAANDQPIPYKHTKEYPALGYPDSTDDIRGGVGEAGFKALYEFVQQGGTIITEGNTAQNLVELGFTPGVKVEAAQGLFARGTILRGMIADKASPLVYGYEQADIPVYFSQAPVFNAGNLPPVTLAGAPAAGGRGGRGGSSEVQNTTPMATPLKLSPWVAPGTTTPYGEATSEIIPNPGSPVMNGDANGAAGGRGGRGGRGAGGGRSGFGGGAAGAESLPGFTPDPASSTRVVMAFPAQASDMLLSGTLENGELLANRAQLVDETVGKGHIVMFAFRPYWRWQTQGTFAMGFNAIVNWNHLDAGK